MLGFNTTKSVVDSKVSSNGCIMVLSFGHFRVMQVSFFEQEFVVVPRGLFDAVLEVL